MVQLANISLCFDAQQLRNFQLGYEFKSGKFNVENKRRTCHKCVVFLLRISFVSHSQYQILQTFRFLVTTKPTRTVHHFCTNAIRLELTARQSIMFCFENKLTLRFFFELTFVFNQYFNFHTVFSVRMESHRTR